MPRPDDLGPPAAVVLQLTTRTRSRIAVGLLAVLAVWPGLHHGLVRGVEIDPWAFFGWSMYAVPNLRINVRAGRVELDASGEMLAETVDWNAISPHAYRAMRAYAERRAVWGRLLAPDALAEEIFAGQPDLPGVVIRVRRWVIDRDSARIAPRDIDYAYAAPGSLLSRRR